VHKAKESDNGVRNNHASIKRGGKTLRHQHLPGAHHNETEIRGSTSLRRKAQYLKRRLLAWQAKCGRQLPWRYNATPFTTLLAQVLLQHTGLASKKRVRAKVVFSNVFVSQCRFRKLFELFETVLDEFWKACSGSEIMVSNVAFGEVLASPKVETVLFRRLSIQLSLGGLLSSRVRLCFTGQRQCAPLAVLIHFK